MFYDRGNHHDFLSLVRQLDPPGELSQTKSYKFEFSQVEKPYETYTGTNVRLRWAPYRMHDSQYLMQLFVRLNKCVYNVHVVENRLQYIQVPMGIYTRVQFISPYSGISYEW